MHVKQIAGTDAKGRVIGLASQNTKWRKPEHTFDDTLFTLADTTTKHGNTLPDAQKCTALVAGQTSATGGALCTQGDKTAATSER